MVDLILLGTIFAAFWAGNWTGRKYGSVSDSMTAAKMKVRDWLGKEKSHDPD